MKIRSITYFCNPGLPLDKGMLRSAGEFIKIAASAFQDAGYEVQSTRLATPPFPHILKNRLEEDAIRLATELEQELKVNGIEYACLGPALPELPASYHVIPEALAQTQSIFFSGIMADATSGISLVSIRLCAEVIVRAAVISPDGFANLRFAALANVPPGSPFFPAAYWDDRPPAFALALESADLAVDAFTRRSDILDARSALTASIEHHARQLVRIATSLHHPFLGLDFSLAPFPETARSVGTAFERMGVPSVGMHGSLASAAILAEAIDRVDFPRCGFNGLFMPVLEDATLAERAANGTLTIKDLLLYSAVCGTGLDTIPLPGDANADQISALMLDLSALALRLSKPLTARLMPIPGKKAGDPTDFQFSLFGKSRIMALDAAPLSNFLSRDTTIPLSSRTLRPIV